LEAPDLVQGAHARRRAARGLRAGERAAHGCQVEAGGEVRTARSQDYDASRVVGRQLGHRARQLVPERRAHGVPSLRVRQPKR
jgi:hypothetical protein